MSSNNYLRSGLAKEQGSIEPVEAPVEHSLVHAKDVDHGSKGFSLDENDSAVQANGHGVPELVGDAVEGEQEVENRGPKGGKEWLAYIKTKQFWLVLLFGWASILVMCIKAN